MSVLIVFVVCVIVNMLLIINIKKIIFWVVVKVWGMVCNKFYGVK